MLEGVCFLRCLKVLFLALIAFSNNVLTKEIDADLILAGGALKTCSSMSQKQCKSTDKIATGKKRLLFKFSQNALERLQQTSAFHNLDEESKKFFHSVIEHNYSNGGGENLKKNQFLDALDDAAEAMGKRNFIRNLVDPVYFALLDTHEVFQTDENGKRLREIVSVRDNKSPHSREIYNAFIRRAAQIGETESPNIVVITASSRDYFESADFYLGAMTSAGGNPQWLPLSATWQAALHLNRLGVDGCAQLNKLHQDANVFDAQRRYPERANKLEDYCANPEEFYAVLAQAHGVFFNGGDQSKTLAALLTPDGKVSKALSIIRSKVKAKQLVVGGTSAGTAVQAGGVYQDYTVPMLTNGTSYAAFNRGIIFAKPPSVRCSEGSQCATGTQPDDLTIRPEGGTGLFNLGLLDTHFSERNREARLVMATLASQQRFGFGVDETTALMVDFGSEQTRLKVIGEGGVFVADLTDHQYKQFVDNGQTKRQVGGMAHFLPADSEAVLDANGLRITFSKQTMTRKQKLRDDEALWRSQLRQSCGKNKMLNWQHGDLNFVVAPGKNSVFSESKRDCGYTFVPFVISN